jgi:alpha-mannosidase
MRLTMLRTPRYPRPAGESWVHTERKIRKDKFGTEPPIFSGLGFMRCRYGLFPHHGGALSTIDGKPNSIVKRIAEEFNVPVIVQSISPEVKTGTSAQSNGTSLLTLEPNHVLITTIKQKEWISSKNLILRVVEVAGHPSKNSKIIIHPEIASKIKNVNCTDLLERKLPDQVKWDANKGQISFAIGKFEILTFELEV